MAGNIDQFWELFFERHPHLDSPEGREAAQSVLRTYLPHIHRLPVFDGIDEIARRTQKLLAEAAPPPSLGRTIQERAEYRENHR